MRICIGFNFFNIFICYLNCRLSFLTTTTKKKTKPYDKEVCLRIWAQGVESLKVTLSSRLQGPCHFSAF